MFQYRDRSLLQTLVVYLNKFVDLFAIEDSISISIAILTWDILLGDTFYDDLYADNFNDQTGVSSTTASYDGADKSYSGVDFTLTTNSFEASANDPTSAWCFLDIEFIDTIIMNTDVKVDVSIDDGVTFDQLTLESTATRVVGDHNYFRGSNTNLSPQDDKTVKFQVTMFNSKNMKLHGIAGGLVY